VYDCQYVCVECNFHRIISRRINIRKCYLLRGHGLFCRNMPVSGFIHWAICGPVYESSLKLINGLVLPKSLLSLTINTSWVGMAVKHRLTNYSIISFSFSSMRVQIPSILPLRKTILYMAKSMAKIHRWGRFLLRYGRYMRPYWLISFGISHGLVRHEIFVSFYRRNIGFSFPQHGAI
jgi:hypothetical protein